MNEVKEKKVQKNAILEYYQKIKNGEILVGKWILLLYEYLIEGLQKKEFFFDAKKANRAINFIENYVHHSKGRNDLLKLELWQKAFISTIFGIVDENGVRRFKEILLVVSRKNGKSLLASAIMAYLAYADGEYGGEVYVIAPKLDQAEICWSSFWQITQQDPELKERIKSRKTDAYIAESNTTLKKIAFSARKSDGLNPSLVVCDELASWQGDAGKKQYEVLASALGARKQPMILSCTTSGYVNAGIYDDLILRSTRFLLGDSKEKRLCPFIYQIDDIEKWNDITELQKSNPNLGVSVTVDFLLDELAIAEGSLSKKSEFITKYCCLKQNSSQAWLATKDIENACCNELKMEQFKSHYCVAGIDLSQTTDLTSACLLIEEKGELYAISHFWLPEEKIAEASARDGLPYDEFIQKGWMSTSGDNYVQYKDIYNWLVSAVENYELLPLQVGYDRYSSQYLVQDLTAYGFLCDDVNQGYNLHPVLVEMEGIIKDKHLHIGNNDLLKIHLLDSALEADTRNGKLRLKKLKATAHIDGTVALVCALCVRQKWFSDIGDRLKNS